MAWLWLALLSAVSLATADAVTKYGLKNAAPETLVVARFALAALGVAPLAFFEPWSWPSPGFWIRYATLLPIEIAAGWLYVRALQASPLSLALPMLAFTPLFLVPSSFLLLGELPAAGGAAGVLLIVAGAYLLGLRAGGRPARWWEPIVALGREPGVRFMFATAVLYAVTTPLAKGAMAQVGPLQFAALYFGGLAVVSGLIFRRPAKRRAAWRGKGGAWLLLGISMTTMAAAHFVALSLAQAPYMIAVKRTSLLFGILAGVLWFGERQGRQRIAAGALMVLGVLAIAASA